MHLSVRSWPGMRSVHAVVPPHPRLDDTMTVTGPGQIGVGFTGHRNLVHDQDGPVTADLAPGSTTVTGDAPVRWLRVHEATEALEIYPDPDLLARITAGASRPVTITPRVGIRDGVVQGVASVLRQVHSIGAELDDVAASTLAHRLATHLVVRHGGARLEPPPRRLLDAHAVDRVADVVEARLSETITLDELAAVVHLSPHHFARLFTRTTGVPPHRFVTAQRMDRARVLLRTSRYSVPEVARLVGYQNPSHFRRVFRRLHGHSPGELRDRCLRSG